MKRVLYWLMVSASCVAMDNVRRFDRYQHRVKKLEPYHNHHFTQIRFTKQNTSTMYQRQQKNYAPKPKGR